MPGTVTVRADEVRVGDTAVQRDGYPLAVVEVRRRRGLVEIVCHDEGGPLRGGRPTCRARPATRVRIEPRREASSAQHEGATTERAGERCEP